MDQLIGQAAPGAANAAANMIKDGDQKTFMQDVIEASRTVPVLVDFWATWCGPCKVEIPWFVEFQQKYGPAGLQVVGISLDDTHEQLTPFVAQLKMNYVVLQGLGHDDVQDAYGPMWGIPVTVLISRDGKICAKHTGMSAKEAFEDEIRSLLNVVI
jgi:thiol-disulfide isomerase/thioredoxin